MNTSGFRRPSWAAFTVLAVAVGAALSWNMVPCNLLLNWGSIALSKGLVTESKAHLGESRNVLERAVLASGRDNRAFHQLGRVYRALRDYTSAEETLLQADSLAPDDILIHYDLGLLYGELGRTELAVNEWRSADAYHPIFLIAQEYTREQRWKDAARLYQIVLSIHPQHARSVSELGRSLFRGYGEQTQAIHYLRQGIDLEPSYIVNYLELGEVYRSMGQHDQAAYWFERAREAFPQSEEPLVLLGGNLYSQARWPEAILYFQQALALNPHSVLAHANLGRTYHALGRLNEAEQELQQAVALAPANAWSHELLGRVYHQQKRYDLALAEYQKAIEVDPDYATYYALIGDVYRDQGFVAEAITAYRRALDLDSQLTYAREQLERLQSTPR